jgi:acyl-CoA synthetase (AMP-forming)/AMP-acid ligase II
VNETLVSLLRGRAERHPERTAFTFLVDGGQQQERWSHGELDRAARRLAALLQRMGGAGERALLLYEPGPSYLVGYLGCLYAGWIAVPAYPPDPLRRARTLPRIQGIIEEASPEVILTSSQLRPVLEMTLADLPPVAVVATDDLPRDEDGWRAPAIDADSVAFLQYTSGSVAQPKGVMVSHGNLIHNLSLIAQSHGLGEDTRVASWLPPYHDMGLIGSLLAPLSAGGEVVFMSPLRFLARPIRWLRAVTRHRSTKMVGPSFAFALCASKVGPEQLAELDLSTVRIAYNGSEPLRADVMERFSEAFAPCGFRRSAFYPCYGLAESTLIVSGRHGVGIGPGGAVSSGRAMPGTEVRIVDPDTLAPRTDGEIGEIWLRGPSVARGYWGRVDESERVFGARTDAGEGPYLRTGDLGFLAGGELYVAGRLKDLVKIRGRNLYPQDIEATVEIAGGASRPNVCAAFGVDVDGAEQLAIVSEIERDAGEPGPLFERIVAAVSAAHDVRPATITLIDKGTLPKTSSGKLQRQLCKRMLAAGDLAVSARWPMEVDQRAGRGMP